MREINIETFDDKRIKVSDKGNLGDKNDNEVTQVHFIFDSCHFHKSLIYVYFVYKLKEVENYTLIDISNNKTIILDYNFMQNDGVYDCLIILSDKEIKSYITNEHVNFVSDLFSLYITDNYLTLDNLKILENKEAL